MKTNTLQSSADYGMFIVHPHNRDISNTKVLTQSMKRFGFDPGLPIRCVSAGHGKLLITHGHHRFQVAASLGLPIWYIISDMELPLFDSEVSNHAWSIKDFTTARARANEPAAIEVMKYHKRTGIPLNACISILGGENSDSGNKKNQLKSGTLKIVKTKYSEDIAEIVIACKEMGFKFACTAMFVGALSRCLYVDQFDKDLFLRRVKTHPETMEPCRTLDQYLDMIEFVYNRMAKAKKIPLAFLAKEASQKRHVTFGKEGR